MNPSQDPVPSELTSAPTPVAPETPVAPVASTPVGPTADNPGKTLGIVSLILSIIGVGLVGLILGIVGMNKSKAAGQKNGFALAGIIVGAVNILFGLIFGIIFIAAAGQLATKCAELGAGSHYVDGVTYSCPAS